MRHMCCLQLLDTSAVGVRREKMYQLDDHVACAVAGITGAYRRCGPISTSHHRTHLQCCSSLPSPVSD